MVNMVANIWHRKNKEDFVIIAISATQNTCNVGTMHAAQTLKIMTYFMATLIHILIRKSI
jgi:hypothetical protein